MNCHDFCQHKLISALLSSDSCQMSAKKTKKPKNVKDEGVKCHSIVALFKKQTQTQASGQTHKHQESDDEVQIIKEEKSKYFSPDKKDAGNSGNTTSTERVTRVTRLRLKRSHKSSGSEGVTAKKPALEKSRSLPALVQKQDLCEEKTAISVSAVSDTPQGHTSNAGKTHLSSAKSSKRLSLKSRKQVSWHKGNNQEVSGDKNGVTETNVSQEAAEVSDAVARNHEDSKVLDKSGTCEDNLADGSCQSEDFQFVKTVNENGPSNAVVNEQTSEKDEGGNEFASTQEAPEHLTRTAEMVGNKPPDHKVFTDLDKTTASSSGTETEQNPKHKHVKNSQDIDNSGIVEETDAADHDGQKEDGEEVTYRIPYYLENFLLILNSVLEDEFYKDLFNESDMSWVKKFHNLTESAQKLYIRLFGRQFRWIRWDRIKYPKISEDLTDIFKELVREGLLLNESSMSDLNEVLQALPSPELKTLAKTLRLQTQGQRAEIIEAVLKHSKQNNITSFFSSRGGGMEAAVLKRAKGLLGSCYKLVQEGRAVFIRIIMLFSLHQVTGEEDEQGGGQQQLFQILMSNIGKMVYPAYTVNRHTKVFSCRQDLLRFETALLVESDIREAMERNDFETSLQLYESTKPVAEQILKDKDTTKHVSSLPKHLLSYTAGASYVRLLNQGVEVLQKLRRYKDAVDLLEELLAQELYHPDYRGRWYDRLALNTHQHLKQPETALNVCKRALKDPHVRTGHRYAILQRAHRICHTPSLKKLLKRWKEFSKDPMNKVQESPKVTIQGRKLHDVYISEESINDPDNVTVIKHVEDVALRHYHDNGYPEGIHGEGGTLRCLLSLFLWDIIFMDVPDVFHNKYQAYPLDISSDSFYLNRQEAIDSKLAEIRSKSPEELGEEVVRSWEAHFGVLCVGLNWERFDSADHVRGLVECLGGHVLAGIIERLVKDMRHTSSGGPDLTVWNVQTKQFRIVEVKGPGDRLSTKQILWLDYLRNLGVEAEVCHVEAVGAKKLQYRAESVEGSAT